MSDDEDWWTQVQEARKRAREQEQAPPIEGQLSLAPPSFDEMIPPVDKEEDE